MPPDSAPESEVLDPLGTNKATSWPLVINNSTLKAYVNKNPKDKEKTTKRKDQEKHDWVGQSKVTRQQK